MTHIKTRSEIVKQYNNCRSALQASCESYDNGNTWEAQRLATSVYMMVHDGGRNSRSILTQLGLRASTGFVSFSKPVNERNLLPSNPLVIYNISSVAGAQAAPMLDNGPIEPKTVQFPTWWENESVFFDNGAGLNRRRLIFSLRNQDGGAHLDATLTDQEYIAMKLTAPKWSFVRNGGRPEKIVGEELATMRHVAFELLKTLDALGEVS